MVDLRSLALCLGWISITTPAWAGGLYLPGIGAVSTGRAGASTAAVDNPEALLLNPAKLAGLPGTQIMIGFSLIDFDLTFDRFGSYDSVTGKAVPWAGQDYPTVHESSDPPVGLGPFQAIPMFAVSSDLGRRVPGLTIAGGVYVPQSYPLRSVSPEYRIDDPVVPPPPTRYDIVKQDAEFLVATVGAAYRVLPSLDIGARFAMGSGRIKARTFVWGLPNFEESTDNDGDFELDVRDNFIPSGGFGLTYRPRKDLEVAAQYTGELAFVGKGSAKVVVSEFLTLGGVPSRINASPDELSRCEKGGSNEDLKACVDLTLPMSASIAGRYKFLDAGGNERGDLELDIGWENWSAQRASSFLVKVDAQINNLVTLNEALIRHGFQDTYSVRLGGSYRLAVATQQLTVRAGVAYDTAAAKAGWERIDFDGAARTTLAVGASWRTPYVQFDLGGGAVLEGSRTVGSPCNPTASNQGCDGSGSETPVEDREGVDPINPVFDPDSQSQNPVNYGRYQSHYLMFMLGATAHF
jgi:long-subunit fatty acid transport protein